MKNNRSEKIIKELLLSADIEINGHSPWDIMVKDRNFYNRFIYDEPSIAFGEAYMKGELECEKTDEAVEKIIKADLHNILKKNRKLLFLFLKERFLALSRKKDPFVVGREHYDLGNDLFESMLDKRMVYTCGYWKNAKNLDEAQEAKDVLFFFVFKVC